MKPVRIGFIGIGYIAIHAHLPGLAPLVEDGQVEFTAFCDVDGKALAEHAATFGARATYTDHREMLDKEELDALYVCLPPTRHTDQIAIAADKGIAVFVEKPQTLDLAQARAFVAAVQAGDPSRVKSSYTDALNSLAAVLGANASAECGGQLLALDDLVAGKI